jgi:hypothetical protein
MSTSIEGNKASLHLGARNTSIYDNTFEWIESFFLEGEKWPRPRFVYTHLFEAHEEEHHISNVDIRLSKHIKLMKNQYRTATIIMADHGPPVRQGRGPQRLPLMSLTFSDDLVNDPWVKNVTPALKTNTFRLISPKDIYMTLSQFAGKAATDAAKTHVRRSQKIVPTRRKTEKALSKPSERTLKQRLEGYTFGTPQSLFYQLSANRTCSDASVAERHCSCREGKITRPLVNINQKRLASLTRLLIMWLNMKNVHMPKCRRLSVNTVFIAEVQVVVYRASNTTLYEYGVRFNVNEGMAPRFAGSPPIPTEFVFSLSSACRFDLHGPRKCPVSFDSVVQETRWRQNIACAPAKADPRYCVCQPDNYGS